MLFRAILFMFLSLPLRAAELPKDVSGEAWFDHCRQLAASRLTDYPIVTSHRILYAWQSENGYLWDWENGNHAADAAHYCVRLALYDKTGQPFPSITLFCSVTGRGKNTETWTFGNREIATRFCAVAPETLSSMDKLAPRKEKPARK
jgi:hypothetical protein